MTFPPPPAPEIRGRLRAVWDRLSRRQLLDAGDLLAPLPAAEPAVRNARAVWHLGMRETDAALELLRPLALLPDEISLDPGADIAWRANFVLALLKAGNRDGFEHNLKRLDAPDHPGVAAMRRLLEEAEKSRGRFSRWFGSTPLPEIPSEFPVGWPEDWLAAEPSPPREIPASALPQPRPSASPAPAAAPVSPPRPVRAVPASPRPAAAQSAAAKPSKPEDEYDLFISYAHQGDTASRDEVAALVSRLHAELETEFHLRFERPIRIFFDKENIEDFDHWQARCHRALRSSRFLIVFLSRNYLLSDACRWEWEEWCKHELARGMSGHSAASLWFVTLDDLNQPGDAETLQRWKGDLLRRFHVQCHAWRHDDPATFLDASARAELQALTDHVARNLRLLALDRARRGNLPWPNANFVGREPELARLRAALLENPSPAPVGLHGVGGMGKTALAQAFAHHEDRSFPGGCWLLRCEGRDRLTTVFRNLISDLALELTDEEKLDDTLAIRRLFDELRPRGTALFVLDNVDRPELLARQQLAFLAGEPWVRLLYTTREADGDFTRAGADIRPLELDRLPDDQAVDLIRLHQPDRAFAAPEQEAAALEIVRELNGLTLAVETAAIYLGQCDRRVIPDDQRRHAVEITGYLPQLRADLDSGGSGRNESQLREVTATLRPTLARLDGPARTVLQLASLLAPDGIALPWVRAIASLSHPELADDAGPGACDPWTELIRSLLGMRIFHPTPEPRVVAIHRILQRVLESEVTEEREVLETRLLDCIRHRAAALEKETHWQEARWELDPLEALAWLWAGPEESPQLPNHQDAVWLLNSVGLRRHHLADWSRAVPLVRRALAIAEASFGAEHPELARALNNLAGSLQATNRLAEAEPLLRRALAIDEASFGTEHPEVARDLNNLAQLLEATNRLAEAEPLMRRALEILEVSLGTAHPNVASVLNNLAGLLKVTNRLAEAEPLLRRALAIGEASFGSDHPKVANDLNSLALLLEATNRHAETEPLMRRVIAIFETSLGENHPNVATSLSNLALLLKDTNRVAEAEPLYRRALAIDEASFGPEHPAVARDLNNLAGLLYATNRLAEAEPLMRRVIAICETSLGESHPNVAASLSNLAGLLKATNRLAEAEPLMRRALAIREESLVPDHPDTFNSITWLADLLEKLGETEECERLRDQFAERSSNSKAAVAPLTLRQLALRFLRKGEFMRAEQLLVQLLEANFEISGTHSHLARVCLLTDRLPAAREHADKGWEHRVTAKSYILPRIIWFQLLFAQNDGNNAAAKLYIGRLKTALQVPNAHMEWTMEAVLDLIRPQLPEESMHLLTALVAALSDSTNLPTLETIPAWRDAEPLPID